MIPLKKLSIVKLLVLLALYFPLNALAQDLKGKTDINILRKNEKFPWFEANYAKAKSDSATLLKIKPLLKGVKLVVFAGSWCSDTKQLLPKFIAVLDKSGFDYANIELYMLDLNKSSDEHVEKKFDIAYVPTFIFIKNGKETGRIVETVKKPVESEILDVLRKK